ncbi:glycosyltransferase [Patescibacteria group bacterium]|nr:glycosyltransferase [Patescibacteria group bacterium]MCL5798055.1 glycosyltransferase [Patescibacteria group bacterium]
MKKISVIIPTFNRSKSLIRAVKSVIGQTVKPFEIIVSDDGSNDGSEKIVGRIGDPIVKWISAKHTGLPAAVRNKGIKKSRGDWLAFLDSDDKWEENKLEEQIEIIDKYKCGAVCANSSRVTNNASKAGFVSPFSGRIIRLTDLLKENYVVTSSVLIRKDLIQRTGGFPEDKNLLVGEDYALWLRVAAETDFYFINKPLLRYTDNPKSSIRKLGKDDFLQRVEVLENFSRYLAEKKYPFGMRLKTHIYKTLLYYFFYTNLLIRKTKYLI